VRQSYFENMTRKGKGEEDTPHEILLGKHCKTHFALFLIVVLTATTLILTAINLHCCKEERERSKVLNEKLDEIIALVTVPPLFFRSIEVSRDATGGAEGSTTGGSTGGATGETAAGDAVSGDGTGDEPGDAPKGPSLSKGLRGFDSDGIGIGPIFGEYLFVYTRDMAVVPCETTDVDTATVGCSLYNEDWTG
jgi:hypothetical protein